MRELTEAESTMLRELAKVVILDRAARAMVVGATKSGRTIVEMMGEPTEAEQAWDRIRADLAREIRS